MIKCLTEIFCADNFACFFLALKQIHKLAGFFEEKTRNAKLLFFEKKNWSSMEEGVITFVDHFLGGTFGVFLYFLVFLYSVGGNE